MDVRDQSNDAHPDGVQTHGERIEEIKQEVNHRLIALQCSGASLPIGVLL
jgi:hypothetical protein